MNPQEAAYGCHERMKRHTLFIILFSLATWCGAHTETSAQDSTYSKPRSEVAEKIERRLHRFDRELQRSVFVPKGTWMGGRSVGLPADYAIS